MVRQVGDWKLAYVTPSNVPALKVQEVELQEVVVDRELEQDVLGRVLSRDLEEDVVARDLEEVQEASHGGCS